MFQGNGAEPGNTLILLKFCRSGVLERFSRVISLGCCCCDCCFPSDPGSIHWDSWGSRFTGFTPKLAFKTHILVLQRSLTTVSPQIPLHLLGSLLEVCLDILVSLGAGEILSNWLGLIDDLLLLASSRELWLGWGLGMHYLFSEAFSTGCLRVHVVWWLAS